MINFDQLARQMIETFNPHPSATDIVKKHKTHRNARKHLRKLGVSKSEQNNLISTAKKQDPKWPPYK